MPIDQLIKAAEMKREADMKKALPKPSNPPKKTRFESRQFER